MCEGAGTLDINSSRHEKVEVPVNVITSFQPGMLPTVTSSNGIK